MNSKSASQNGVMMAMVVILFSACVMLITAMLQYVTSISGFSNEVVYRQIAQTAAKSALEEGKEKFDGSIRFDQLDEDNNGTPDADTDTNGNGIADTLDEKLLFSNATYRVTYQLTVKSGGTSADGRSKIVTGTGRVYLPANATTPRYIRTINSEVVRSVIQAGDPSDFSPLAWYDAKCGPTTAPADPSCTLPTVLKSGTANVAANPISLREENRTTGSHCGGAPNPSNGTSDGWLSIPRKGECGATTDQKVGLLFNAGAGLTKGTTIQSATLQFRAAAVDTFNPIVFRIRGIKLANAPTFTTANGTQLGTVTTAYTDWTVLNWPTAGQSGAAQQTPNFAAVIQEIMAQASWNTGNNIGIAIECQSGCTGSRRADMTPITLNITYAGYVEAAANDPVEVWRDRSGNGFHLTALDAASRPIRMDTTASSSSVAGPAIQFSTGTTAPAYSASKGMSGTVPVSTARVANSYTTFAILKMRTPTDTTSANSLAAGNGHILSFRGSGTSNVTIAPLWRHPAAGFHSNDSSTGGSATAICQGQSVPGPSIQEYQCRYPSGIGGTGATGGSPWAIYSNRSELFSVEALFRMHGDNSNAQIYTNTVMNFNAPYTIALGYNPANSAKGASFDVSELIVYDRTLTCPQMEAVEKYLAEKWDYENPALGSNSEYISTGCRENNLPAY